MRLPGLVRYMCACVRACVRAPVCARACVCQSMRERQGETETDRQTEGEKEGDMRVGVSMCACGCVGGGDMVYGCGYEGGQDENSDYTCTSYIYSLLIIFECVSYCVFYSAFL